MGTTTIRACPMVIAQSLLPGIILTHAIMKPGKNPLEAIIEIEGPGLPTADEIEVTIAVSQPDERRPAERFVSSIKIVSHSEPR